MVLYFSATGNTEYVAKHIAASLGDESLDLLSRIRSRDYSVLRSETSYVVCLPVFAGDMPGFAAEFLRKTRLEGCRSIYFVYTAAAYAGHGIPHAQRIARSKGMEFKGCMTIPMPNNYVVSSIFPETDTDKAKQQIKKAGIMASEIADTIKRGENLKTRHVILAEQAMGVMAARLWEDFLQPTKPFYSTQLCTGCGLCAKKCPLGIIKMTEGRPAWTERKCAHCMSCIQNCPTRAIEFGGKTQAKARYRLRPDGSLRMDSTAAAAIGEKCDRGRFSVTFIICQDCRRGQTTGRRPIRCNLRQGTSCFIGPP